MSVEEANRRAQSLLRSGRLPGVTKVQIVQGTGQHKYKAIYNDNRTIQWGHKDYDDFLVHKNEKRRQNFNSRFHKLIVASHGDPSKKAFWFVVNW